MKLLNKISVISRVLTAFAVLFAVDVFAVGNPVDSDLSNRAGTNSGNSHLDIYLFIIALLILCIIVPFFENKNKNTAGR